MSGVYEIWNSQTSQILNIGSARDLRHALRKLLKRLRLGRGRNRRLQEAYDLFGDGLEFRTLAQCDPATLRVHKRGFIGLLQPELQGASPRNRGATSKSTQAGFSPANS